MPQIEISEETYRALKQLAEPFEDTPESVIRQLLNQHSAPNQAEKQEGTEDSPEERVNHVAGAALDLSPGELRELNGRRAKPGEFTPPEEFEDSVITALSEAGGELSTQDAIDRVGELMKEELKPMDMARIPSGEIRWRNNARWARQKLVEKGKLDSDSPHGVWRLSQNDD